MAPGMGQMTSLHGNPRLLRHTPGTSEPLAANGAHVFAARHALLHYRSGAVFTFIPKNACTSLRVSLAIANGTIADTADWTWVHRNNDTFAAGLADLARAPVTAVILRCPFRRLASTFLDKIVSRSGPLWVLHRLSRDRLDPDRLTFRSFVDSIASHGFLRADIHWHPQYEFLVYDRYDRVFGMHELPAFATFFEETTGQPLVDARAFAGNATSAYAPATGGNHADRPLAELTRARADGRLPHPRDLFDPPLVDRVREIYAEDLQLYRDLVGAQGLLFAAGPERART